MSPAQQQYAQNFKLMSDADHIAPIGSEIGDINLYEKLAALASSGGLKTLIEKSGGLRINLELGDYQGNAERIMSVLDILGADVGLFEVSVQEDAAFLVPPSTVRH